MKSGETGSTIVVKSCKRKDCIVKCGLNQIGGSWCPAFTHNSSIVIDNDIALADMWIFFLEKWHCEGRICRFPTPPSPAAKIDRQTLGRFPSTVFRKRGSEKVDAGRNVQLSSLFWRRSDAVLTLLPDLIIIFAKQLNREFAVTRLFYAVNESRKAKNLPWFFGRRWFFSSPWCFAFARNCYELCRFCVSVKNVSSPQGVAHTYHVVCPCFPPALIQTLNFK